MSGDKKSIKLIMLGESGVGKTAFSERVKDDFFRGSLPPTFGAQYFPFEYEFKDEIISIELWDTAGQETFRALVSFYLRESKGAFVLFDMTDHTSFSAVQSWISFLHEKTNNAKVLLFGNKVDLEEKRAVFTEEIETFSQKLQIPFYEGSAKTGQNIKEAVDKMLEMTISQTW